MTPDEPIRIITTTMKVCETLTDAIQMLEPFDSLMIFTDEDAETIADVIGHLRDARAWLEEE